MSKEVMTPSERVHAALAGKPVDRVPLCIWHHFQPQGSGQLLAEQTLEFFKTKFDLDIVKIMPDLDYPDPDPINDASQYRSLPRLGLDTPLFQEQLTCVRQLRSQLGPEYPLILTLFSPVTYALRFAASGKKRGLELARQNPEAFEQGLQTVTANLRELIPAAIDAGASGIFFSCMGATNTELTREEYARFGRPYDLQVLETARSGWLNILHAHVDPDRSDDELYFDIFTDYPVQALSWSDHLTAPTLREARRLTTKCLVGGLDERGPMVHGPETELEAQIADALDQTGGLGLILANGCSIPDDTLEEWLYITRRLINPIEP